MIIGFAKRFRYQNKRRGVLLEHLLKQDPIAMGMLGKQPIREEKYRPLTYVLMAEEADKKIFYNLLTHEMIAVNVSELESPDARQYFIENWYLVPEDHDDQQLVDECRAVLTLMNSCPKKIHVFHIFTTLDCNARCFYCFEKRIAGSHMTMETAARAIEYMQEQADGTPIKIVWFGGEPLFNYPVIDFISSGLRDRELQFESEMISNGLLFDADLTEKAKTLWNMKKIQITLDGTGQVYNKIKAYVTNIENPFERVLNNIKSLLKEKIRVSIRINVGLHNTEEMRELVDFLCREFKSGKGISVYTSPLIELRDYTDEEKTCVYELLEELDDKLNKVFGKKIEKEFSDRIRNSYCMATGREAVTILPDGRVGICENITSGVLLGNIYGKELDAKARADFGRRFYREDKCRPCPLYPNCYIVNGCPNKDEREGCEPVMHERRIKRIKDKMKMRYRLGADGAEGYNSDEKGKGQSDETEI